MNKNILFVVPTCLGLAIAAYAAAPAAKAPAAMAMPSCGQMTASKAVLPAKMAELTTAVADMYDAHAAFMATDKSKEAMAEVEGLKKLALQHRELAAMFTKTSESMKGAAAWPVVAHDHTKMMADKKLMESMGKMLTTHKEMAALMQKEIAEMEAMGGHKVN
jgi:hypothetical protein